MIQPKQITLIRHTSVDVASGVCYGQSDVDVSATFVTEAQRVLLDLQEHTFDAVYCSPLSRCRKLASFCGFAEPIIDDRLLELNFGDWELKVWENISDPQLERWFSDWINEIPTNGESFSEQLVRVNSFIIDLKNTEFQNIVIFTHAGIIRSFGVILEQLPIHEAFNYKVDYGQIIKLIL